MAKKAVAKETVVAPRSKPSALLDNHPAHGSGNSGRGNCEEIGMIKFLT
jgi:hypothetical protein